MNYILTSLILLLTLQSLAQQRTDFTYAKDYPLLLKLSKEESSDFYYPKLFERYLKGDSTLTDKEVLALQIGYTTHDKYWPYQDIILEREIWRLNANGHFEAALLSCDTLFSRNPFSLLAAREKSYAYHKMGNPDSADYYYRRFDKLMKSVLSTGDGLSYETSWFVLSPADGQWIIKLAFQKSICTMGSGRDTQGNFHDILGLELEKDEEDRKKTKKRQQENDCLNLYFNINHASKRMFGKSSKATIDELPEEHDK